MKKLIVILSIVIFFLSFNKIQNKKIIGHWISENDLYEIKANDTLIFTKIKYTDKLYEWGGALAGIDLNSDSVFSEYHNVLCSSESSPVRYNNEKWTLHNNMITINGSEREMNWQVLSANNKLTIVVLKIDLK